MIIGNVRILLAVFLAFFLLRTTVWPSPQKTAPNINNPSTLEDFQAGDETREKYQRAADVLAELGLSKGDFVADVGAGAGYYAMRLSAIVGPTGKVIAEDISDYAMKWLNQRVKVLQLGNIEVRRGQLDDPGLPADSLAGILVVNSYHHFKMHQPMLEHILRALKPGGRLVIGDYSLPAHRVESRADQIKIHEISPELVQAELEQAGFKIVKHEDPFVKRIPEVTDGDRIAAADMWLIVAARPK